MKTHVLVLLLLVGIVLPFRNSCADTGQVHASDATVRETGQKAILLHNSREQVLILGTDLEADSEIGLIRFIPFPAEPQVSLAPPDVFETVAALLAKHRLEFLVASKSGTLEACMRMCEE